MRTKKQVRTVSYAIAGGEYDTGGTVSKCIKEMLMKIGVEPATIRRTMIATYEAEMNVVIHAYRGIVRVALSPELLDVSFHDEGPGIPDIEQAMRDGYSTAPEAARELGFGAGMGLSHIRKNSDRFSLQSKVGSGTRLHFSIFLKPEVSSDAPSNSVAMDAKLCCQCLRCLHACPTNAIRVREGRPHLLSHLCVDCTSCIAACEASALHVQGLREIPKPQRDTVLVIPGSFLEQFGAATSPGQVIGILASMGFQHIRLLDEWENALRKEVVRYAREEASVTPVLSPACPAVLNLIRMRFPALLPNVAPFLSPIEAAREDVNAPHAVFVAVCPAQTTVLRQKTLLTRIDIVHPATLRAAVSRQVQPPPREGNLNGQPRQAPDTLQVSGMKHVLKVLEAVDSGRASNFRILELAVCDQACFGSPVWVEDPFIAQPRYEWEREYRPMLLNREAETTRRVVELTPRAGMRLDKDMGKAIEKLAAIDDLSRKLPGRNCCVCGAPSCVALAEDVILERCTADACVFRTKETE